MTDDVVEELCSFATRLSYDDLPVETVETAKLRVFDSLVTGLMSLREDPVRRLVSHASTEHGAAGAPILGTEHAASVEYAAFANAGMIRYLDWNDTYLSAEAAHPSGNIGAILAAGAANGRSGRELLAATALAYEAQCRLCDLASFTGTGFDHVNYGLVSVPLAVGRLMGLSEAELHEAVSISLGGHLGLLQSRQAPLSEWKSFAFGNVARNGVAAAELAAAGIHGPSGIFTGEHGVNSVVDARIDAADLALGEGFLIDETHLKRYPICHHILAAIDCVDSITDRADLDPAAIESIDIGTYEIAIRATAGEGRWRPTTRGTADHSLPYCVARALVDGTIGPDELDESRLADDDVVAVMDRVDVHHEASFTERYGDAFAHEVRITTADGEYERQVDYPLGHYKNPLSWDDVATKVLDHARCSPGPVRDLRAAAETLDEAPDVDALFDVAAAVGAEL